MSDARPGEGDASGRARRTLRRAVWRAASPMVGVRKSFDVTKALDGATFSASLGAIHAIFGGNGCGKSTLAKVISGVLPVDSGQVNVLGHTPNSPHDARAAGIATVFQEVLVADECSILDNLYIGADRLWSRTQTRVAKINAAETLMTELTGLDLDLEMPVGALPLSLKAWITIGRALLTKPKILILDESSAALDLDSTERLFAKIRELRDSGSCVLIVTHRIAEMIRIADRVTVLRDGRDVGVLEKGEITEKPTCCGLMAGRKSRGWPKREVAPQDMRAESVVLKADAMKIWPRSREFEFRLHRGEIVGVAGLEGQGQSEFVRILAGVAARARLRFRSSSASMAAFTRSTALRTPRVTRSAMSRVTASVKASSPISAFSRTCWRRSIASSRVAASSPSSTGRR